MKLNARGMGGIVFIYSGNYSPREGVIPKEKAVVDIDLSNQIQNHTILTHATQAPSYLAFMSSRSMSTSQHQQLLSCHDC